MTRVYTAGPDGRCTVCQRPEAEHAPEAWTTDARACPPAELAASRCTVCDGPIDDDGECRCPTCSSCDGAGIVRDAQTGGLRRCSSCRGSGETDGLHAGFPPGGVWSANGDHVPRTVMPAEPPALPVTAYTVTDEQILLRAAPATWDGVRDFEVRALQRITVDPLVAADCAIAIALGSQARDALTRIAAAIHARANGAKP